MITKQQYVEYLISTVVNYTGRRLAEHLDGVSHDVITDYLRTERLTVRGPWPINWSKPRRCYVVRPASWGAVQLRDLLEIRFERK
ncbi:hypothetical protein TFLX_01837 [Thermoflexales bacterium]|nr:hypothetical protein TFLX_01837 [Thermoflexales bacterium]